MYDHDTFSKDDKMGTAEIDIRRFVECLKMTAAAEDGAELCRIRPGPDNCLSRESSVVWKKGKMSQEMTVRLKDVECGELHLQIEWHSLTPASGNHK